jgi:hypothetical protein
VPLFFVVMGASLGFGGVEVKVKGSGRGRPLYTSFVCGVI